jgi:hypothetical protein
MDAEKKALVFEVARASFAPARARCVDRFGGVFDLVGLP